MKIAISATGSDLCSALDARFGRTSQFIIYDLDNDSYISVDNEQNLTSAQGAGIQSAQTIIKTGAEAVITGNVGPNAFRTLTAGNVDIYLGTGLTVQEAIDKFKNKTLQKASGNNVEGHWM